MTAYAISFQPRRVLIASETLAYLPDRTAAPPLGFVLKVWTIPRLRAAIVARGQMSIALAAAARLMATPALETVEDAAEELPAILRRDTQDYCANYGIDRTVGLLELQLIGWSVPQQRMLRWGFSNVTDYDPQPFDGYGTIALPALPRSFVPKLPTVTKFPDLVRVIHAIDKFFVAEPALSCGARAGGEIIGTEITPDGIAWSHLHRFANYAEQATAGAAMMARIERGEIDVSRTLAEGLVPAGEMVDASAAPAVPPIPVPLSRQQRRAAERAERKGRRAA